MNTSYSYDNLSRLLSVTHARSGATLDGASHGLDNASNRTSKSDLFANVTTNYGYDNIYELLNATQSSTTTESYTYDPVCADRSLRCPRDIGFRFTGPPLT